MKTQKALLCVFILLTFLLATPIYSLCQQNTEARRIQLLKDLRSEDRRLRRKAAEELGRLGDEQAISGLIGALRDSDQFVSAASALALGELKAKLAVDILVELLRSPSTEVRGSSAQALGRIGDTKATQALLSLLNDPEVYPRSAALGALGRIGDASIITNLTSILVKDPESQVRTSAAEALGRIGDRQASEALVKALKDSSNYVRTAAAVALSQTGGENATLALIEALKDTDRLVRSAAAESLGRSNDLRGVRPLIEALGDPDQFVRTNAAYSLGRLGDRQAVEPLMDAVHLDDSRVKNRAIDSLGAIADKRALPILIDTLQDKDRIARSNSVIALGKIGDKRAVDPLIQSLADPDSNTRKVTVEALTKLNDERAFDPIVNLIKTDNDQGVKASAINSLAKLNPTKAIDPLLEVFQGKSLELRNLAAIALGQTHQPAALKAILKLMSQVDFSSLAELNPSLSLFFKEGGEETKNQLKSSLSDSDLATRQQALLLTSILAGTDRAESLIAALKDPKSEMRALAALLIGRAKDIKAVPELRQALTDKDEAVRTRASEALALIGVPKYEPPKVLSDTNTVANLENPNSTVPVLKNSATGEALPPTPTTSNVPLNTKPNDVPLTASSGNNIPSPPIEPVENSKNTKDIIASNSNSNETKGTEITPNLNLPKIADKINLPKEGIQKNEVAKDVNPTKVKDLNSKNQTQNNNQELKETEVAKLEEVKPEIPKPTITPVKPNFVAKNEAAIIGLLQQLLEEQKSFSSENGAYADLQTLVAKSNLDKGLEDGESNGYEVTLYVSQATAKRPARFFVIATPLKYGESGERSFFMDESGILRTNPINNTAAQVGQVYGSWKQVNN
jgi:HEAT repeat protein